MSVEIEINNIIKRWRNRTISKWGKMGGKANLFNKKKRIAKDIKDQNISE